MVQPRVRDLFAKYYPNYGGEEAVFWKHVDAAVVKNEPVLDAGCGRGSVSEHDFRAEGRIVIGVDLDEAVGRNKCVTYAVRASLDALPLRSNSVGLIVSHYVVEHLEKPRQTFTEFARVLRPEGRFVFLTPNVFHYVTLISRFTPDWVHRVIKRGHGLVAEDVFPTYYRANTVSAIEHLARDAGLTPTKVDRFESSPNYLEFSRLLYRAGILYERLVSRFSVLACFRVNIVVTLTKTVGNPHRVWKRL